MPSCDAEVSSAPRYLLDACAVVNLYATRRPREILAANPGSFAIAEVVAREAQFVWRGGTGDDAREREAIDLQPLIELGMLSTIATDTEEELQTFIDLSLEIDEGEAMTGALAIHRDYRVVSDDRKASRLLAARGVMITSSLALIRVWSMQATGSPEVLRLTLMALRQRGSFEPSRRHPLRTWWDDALASP